MQAMIGRDAVLLLINHRVGLCRDEINQGNCNTTALNAQITVLEEIKAQIDFIMPIHMPLPLKLLVMTPD